MGDQKLSPRVGGGSFHPDDETLSYAFLRAGVSASAASEGVYSVRSDGLSSLASDGLHSTASLELEALVVEDLQMHKPSFGVFVSEKIHPSLSELGYEAE